MIDPRFAKHSDFDRVIKAFEANGFEFLAKITMDGDRFRYHVPMQEVRETNLFFYPVGGKSMFFNLNCSEHVDEHGYMSFWSVKLIFTDDWKKWYIDQSNKTDDIFEREEIPEDIPYDCYFTQNDIGNYGFSAGVLHCETWWEDSWQLPVRFIKALKEFLQAIEPYLYHKFLELELSSFGPYYTFPDNTDDFWRMFPKHRLYRVTKRFEM